MGIPMGGQTEEVVNMLDTACLQPKIFNNQSNSLLTQTTKDIFQNSIQ